MSTSLPEAFYKQLEENPEDWTTRLVMADWYEDNNEPERAEAIRWQVENKRRPRDGKRYGEDKDNNDIWGWFDIAFYTRNGGPEKQNDPDSDLPREVFRLLDKYGKGRFDEDCRYTNFLECEQDCQQAVMKFLTKQGVPV